MGRVRDFFHKERGVFKQLSAEIKSKPCEIVIHLDIALDGPNGPVVLHTVGTANCKLEDLLRALNDRG